MDTTPVLDVWEQESVAASNGRVHCSPKLNRVHNFVSAWSQAARIICFLVICFAVAVGLDFAALSVLGCLCPSAGRLG